MLKDFLKGIASINLFPEERKIKLTPVLSDEEAFKKDQEAIAKDMWAAIAIVDAKLDEKL